MKKRSVFVLIIATLGLGLFGLLAYLLDFPLEKEIEISGDLVVKLVPLFVAGFIFFMIRKGEVE